MAKAAKLYKRLTRSPLAVGAYYSLWLGADHLLLVKSTGYTESYHRYDYSTIEGFVITPSSRRLTWTLIIGIPAALTLMTAVGVVISGRSPAIALFLLVPMLVALIWNFSLGPSVRVQILTPVGQAPLPALVRRRKTDRALAELQPIIEAAQQRPVVEVAAPNSPTP